MLRSGEMRSQESHPLVDYVVLSEFDINTGSTMRHSYPAAIPDYKPDWFAEHMLPEGAHNRDVDYTYIFLNRSAQHIDTDHWINPTAAITIPKNNSTEGEKYFLYGLNVVKTKHDASVRRGAIVKAMCIFSRYYFIESLKRPLELALEEYFTNSTLQVLENLFHSLNSIDLGCVPQPTYLDILAIRRNSYYHTNNNNNNTTAHNKHFGTSADGSNECQDVISCCQVAYTPLSKDSSSSSPTTSTATSLTLSIPIYSSPDEVGDIQVSKLVRIFGEQTMRIYHGLLTKQRILFVGYNHAAADIAQMVLSAVAMISPPLPGIIKRTFPYANLTDLAFLEVKGYIAGVTNPMFQQRDTWWDILCILDLPNHTGTVIVAADKEDHSGHHGHGSSHSHHSGHGHGGGHNSSGGGSNSSGSGGGGGQGAKKGHRRSLSSSSSPVTSHTMSTSSIPSSSSNANINPTAGFGASRSNLSSALSNHNMNNSNHNNNNNNSGNSGNNSEEQSFHQLDQKFIAMIVASLSSSSSAQQSHELVTSPTATLNTYSSSSGNSSAAVPSTATGIAAMSTSSLSSSASQLQPSLGEEWIRQQFLDYTMTLLQFTQDRAYSYSSVSSLTGSHSQGISGMILLPFHRLEEKWKKIAEANMSRFASIETTSEYRYHLVPHYWIWDTAVAASTSAPSVAATTTAASATATAELEKPTGDAWIVGEQVALDVEEGEVSEVNNGGTTGARARNLSDSSAATMTPSIPGPLQLVRAATTATPITAEEGAEPMNGLILTTIVRKLKLLNSITSVKEAESYFSYLFTHCHSEQGLQALLILLPASQGGLLPLAAGLYHASASVRYHTTMLLDRIQSFPKTRQAVSEEQLNAFVYAAYQRNQVLIANGTLVEEMKRQQLQQLKGQLTGGIASSTMIPPTTATGDSSTSPPTGASSKYNSVSGGGPAAVEGGGGGDTIASFFSQTLTLINEATAVGAALGFGGETSTTSTDSNHNSPNRIDLIP